MLRTLRGPEAADRTEGRPAALTLGARMRSEGWCDRRGNFNGMTPPPQLLSCPDPGQRSQPLRRQSCAKAAAELRRETRRAADVTEDRSWPVRKATGSFCNLARNYKGSDAPLAAYKKKNTNATRFFIGQIFGTKCFHLVQLNKVFICTIKNICNICAFFHIPAKNNPEKRRIQGDWRVKSEFQIKINSDRFLSSK